MVYVISGHVPINAYIRDPARARYRILPMHLHPSSVSGPNCLVKCMFVSIGVFTLNVVSRFETCNDGVDVGGLRVCDGV